MITDDKKQSVIKIEHYNKYAVTPEKSNNVIAVVSIDGIITTGPISTDDYNGVDYDTIKKNLKKAVADKKVKAIIVKIDSPGGECRFIHVNRINDCKNKKIKNQ